MRSWAASHPSPSKPVQIDPPVAIELYAFLFKSSPLVVVATGWPPTDPALRVDDSVPRDLDLAGAESPPDRSRGLGHAKRLRDTAIGDDRSPRDPPDQHIHPEEK